MKKILVFLLTLIVSLGLFLLFDNLAYNSAMVTAGLSEQSEIKDVNMGVEVEVVEIYEDNLVVRPTMSVPALGYNMGYYEYLFESSNEYKFSLDGVIVNCELEVGKIVRIIYTYRRGENTIHPMGKGVPYNLYGVTEITDIGGMLEDIVLYNGRRYDRYRLSEEILNWLELSDEEKAQSDYYPQDLVDSGYFDLLSNIEEWGFIADVGIGLPTRISVDLYQKDFIETELNDNWIYSTDSRFEIHKFDIEKQQWYKVETLYGDKEIPWDDSIEIFELDSEIPYGYGINWEWLYGKLPKGEYRIVKEIRVDKSKDEYSWETVYWYFEIEYNY